MLLILYSCGMLSPNSGHTFSFPNEVSQLSYFNTLVNQRLTKYTPVDGTREKLLIDLNINSIQKFDYCSIKDDGKDYYYFIKNKSYKTPLSSLLELELDVIQTYMFDYTYLNSYIDRCHVKRWNGNIPTKEVIDEGIDFGTHVQIGTDSIKTHTNEGIVIACSKPIGKLEVGGHKPDGGGGGTVSQGMLSAKGYRFLKGYEGFGKYPYRVTGEISDTAGYGIREDFQKTYFELLKPFPCSEMLASSVLGTMLIKQFIEPVKNQLIKDGFKIENVKSNHFDVFVSHSMNAGFGAWSNGTPYRLYKEGKSDKEISEAIKTWYITGEGGSILEGLVQRRKSEADIFLNANYNYRTIVTINRDGSFGKPITENNGNGFIPKEFGGDL